MSFRGNPKAEKQKGANVMKKRWTALLMAGIVMISGVSAFPDKTAAEETASAYRYIQNLEQYAPEGESFIPELSSAALGEREPVTGFSSTMPCEGDVKTLVIMTEFPDAEFTEEFKTGLKGSVFRDQSESLPGISLYPKDSLRAYYQRSSFGKLNISGELLEYKAEHERSWYVSDEYYYPMTLYQEVMESWSKEIIEKQRAVLGSEGRSDLELLDDYLAQFDLDNDMNIDGCYVACAGGNNDWGGFWWSFSGSVDNIDIGSYHVSQIIQVVDCRSAPGVKGGDELWDYLESFIHETGHQLGLEDYYSYGDLKIGWNKLHTFDIMGHTLLGEQDGFSRMLLGWLPKESVHWVTEDGVYELRPYAETGDVYLIPSKRDASAGNSVYGEYILAEYYKNTGNDTVDVDPIYSISEKPADGMRFYHIYAKLNKAGNDFIANNSEDNKIPLIFAYTTDVYDQGTDVNSYLGIYQPGEELTPSTVPATSFFYNPLGNGLSEDTTLVDSGISITDIKNTGNGTMSFRVERSGERERPVITETQLYMNTSYGTYVRVVFDQPVNVVGKQSAAIYDRTSEGYDPKEKWCDIKDIRRDPTGAYNSRENELFFMIQKGWRYTDGLLYIPYGLIESVSGVQAGEMKAEITGIPEGASALTASMPSGTYAEPFELTLSGAPEGAEIYYTTNGTEPTVKSEKYSAPIMIEKNTVLKALAIDQQGKAASGRLHTSYVIEKASVSRDQLTLDVGEAFWLTGTRESYSGKNQSGTFMSSDPSIVYVAGNGRLLARKEGQAIITFSSANASAECLVTVKKDVAKDVMDALRDEYGDAWGTWLNALCDELHGTETLEEFSEGGGLTSLRIWTIPDQVYTGAVLKPQVNVYEGVRPLTAGTDYSVSYTKNKNAGTALAKVKYKGTYKKQPIMSREFTIKKAVLGNDVKLQTLGVVYTGKGQKPKPLLLRNDTGAKVNLTSSEFTIAYQSSSGQALKSVKDVGSYKVTVTAKDKNYSGKATQTLTVQKTDVVEKLKVKLKKTTFPVSEAPIELVYGKDYTITTPKGYDPVADENGNLIRVKASVKNNTEKGKGCLILAASDGSGYAGTQTVYFTIN